MLKNQQWYSIFLRYLILIAVALPNLYIFYLIFTPLTVYLSYLSFNLFFDISLKGNILTLEQIPLIVEIIKACVAGSAYYLLLILNLSIPDIKIKKRIKMIIFAFAVFLIINILRIFLLTLLFIYGEPWFDITHKLFWYALSTIFVVGIWFYEVRLFKIDKIPFYSDLKKIYGSI